VIEELVALGCVAHLRPHSCEQQEQQMRIISDLSTEDEIASATATERLIQLLVQRRPAAVPRLCLGTLPKLPNLLTIR